MGYSRILTCSSMGMNRHTDIKIGEVWAFHLENEITRMAHFCLKKAIKSSTGTGVRCPNNITIFSIRLYKCMIKHC